ncbi:MAG TPA: YggT family protein [Gemmatimonadales bacterium]|nr:YggT family protein [Gemmatimonadales bacterium]
MILETIQGVARTLVGVAFVGAVVIALTHWAVRRRRLSPFGPVPRLVRRASDPILIPLERRVIRLGGSPQDAPLWLLGIVIVAGLILLSLLNWLVGTVVTVAAIAHAGPRAIARFAVGLVFTLLMAAILVRVIGSWFGIGRYRSWMRPVYLLTDWIVEPIRRVLPPLGFIDLSPMVAWLVLLVLRGIVLGLI